MGEGLLGLLLKDAQQAPFLTETAAQFFIVFKIFPGHITGRSLQLSELKTQLLKNLLLLN